MHQLRIGERGQLVGTGHQQEITPERQLTARSESEKALDYATKSHTHLWIVMLVHKATDVMLDAFGGDSDASPILDVDTIFQQPAICCLVCEQAYEPRLRRRRCPGDPAA